MLLTRGHAADVPSQGIALLLESISFTDRNLNWEGSRYDDLANIHRSDILYFQLKTDFVSIAISDYGSASLLTAAWIGVDSLAKNQHPGPSYAIIDVVFTIGIQFIEWYIGRI